MKFICPHCKKEGDKPVGHVNRAKKVGAPIYCSRVCSGLARRDNKTIEQRKEEKRLYDIAYRNGQRREEILELRRQYYKTPPGRASSKRNRDNRKEAHKEYIRSDRYRKWKQTYDLKYHAKKNYGDYWEAALILNEIETDLLPVKQEVKTQKGLLNKSQQRKRHGTYRQKSQGLTLGNPSRSTNW